MKLNYIHQDLKELYKGGERVKSFLAFEFTCEKENHRIMKLFKAGYWSVMPFAFAAYNNFGIRLNPKSKINNSSVVQLDDSDGVTVASNIKTFLPLNNLRYLKKIKMLERHFKPKKDEVYNISLPYREYTNSINCLEFFYDYISNPDNLSVIKNSDTGFNKVYLDFWNHYNNTPDQKLYSDLIIKLTNNREFYPDYSEVNYGVWNNRVYNALAQRAYGDLEAKFNKVEKYFWKNLTQTHGFDGLQQGFEIVPNPSSHSYWSLDSILDNFNPDLNRTFSEDILIHPLYGAIQELREKKRGYKGERHIEAAAILDTEYNDPYAAWDALVTASYWAGQAGSKAIEPMWEAAIYLSEKHNWKEIHEVLIQQYEYYNFYKGKI